MSADIPLPLSEQVEDGRSPSGRAVAANAVEPVPVSPLRASIPSAVDIRRTAKISECGRYRYSLDRKWFADRFYSPAKIFGHPMPLIFVMLNPSTADAYSDDPTIRRCVGFAKREGYEWLRVINLYGGRATKPADLFAMADPVGPDNITEWELAREFHEQGAGIVCAWGAEPQAQAMAERFMGFMAEARVELHCLGVTKGGCPKHPLYLPKDAGITSFPAPEGSSS